MIQQRSGSALTHSLGSAREASLTERFWGLSWPLLFLVLSISCLGLLTLYSVAGGNTAPWMDKQAIRLVAGIALMLLIALVPLNIWIGAAWPSYLAALLLLVAVLAVGT